MPFICIQRFGLLFRKKINKFWTFGLLGFSLLPNQTQTKTTAYHFIHLTPKISEPNINPCSLLSRWISSLAHLIYNTLPPTHKTLTLISHTVCAFRRFHQKKKSTKKTQQWVKKYLNPSLYFSLFI